MNISKVLKTVGKRALREVPVGGFVLDMVELVTGEKEDDGITGEQLQKKIEALPPELRAKLLEKTIDSKLQTYVAWADLQESLNTGEQSGMRAKIAMLMAGCVVLLVMFFAGILGHAYMTQGIIPDTTSLLIVFGLPVIGLAGFFGIRTELLQELIVGALAARMKSKL